MFSVVYTLIFNGMCHQSGQNVDSRGATERPFREYMIRDKMKKKKAIYYLQKQCNQAYIICYIIKLRCTVYKVF